MSEYNFMGPNLPIGWFYNGKPALMKDLLTNPFDIKDPLVDLTEAQKWALVEVRVRLSSMQLEWKNNIIPRLQAKTSYGLMIRDEEIESLHALREDLMASILNS